MSIEVVALVLSGLSLGVSICGVYWSAVSARSSKQSAEAATASVAIQESADERSRTARVRIESVGSLFWRGLPYEWPSKVRLSVANDGIASATDVKARLEILESTFVVESRPTRLLRDANRDFDFDVNAVGEDLGKARFRFTLDYRDVENHRIECVVSLPKSSGENITSFTLEQITLDGSSYPYDEPVVR